MKALTFREGPQKFSQEKSVAIATLLVSYQVLSQDFHIVYKLGKRVYRQVFQVASFGMFPLITFGLLYLRL